MSQSSNQEQTANTSLAATAGADRASSSPTSLYSSISTDPSMPPLKRMPRREPAPPTQDPANPQKPTILERIKNLFRKCRTKKKSRFVPTHRWEGSHEGSPLRIPVRPFALHFEHPFEILAARASRLAAESDYSLGRLLTEDPSSSPPPPYDHHRRDQHQVDGRPPPGYLAENGEVFQTFQAIDWNGSSRFD